MQGCRGLTTSEVARIMRELPLGHRCWFAIGCATGLRVSEVLSLRRSDFVFRKGRLSRRVWVPGERLKGSPIRGRLVFLDSTAARLLREWLRRHDHVLVFPSIRDSSRPFDRRVAWRLLRAAAGGAGVSLKGLGTHSMRKTFAQRAYRVLRDLLKTSLVLGHADSRNTARYIEGGSPEEMWKEIHGLAVACPGAVRFGKTV